MNAALGAGLLNFPQVEGLTGQAPQLPQAFDQAGGVLVAVLVQVGIPGNTLGYLGIPGNTWEYLGITGNTRDYLGILGSTWEYLEVPGNT